jgi:peroxiredoxin
MGLIIFGSVLPWLVVGLGCWLLYQLARQQGRILLRLEALEEHLGQRPSGLPPPAPNLPPQMPPGLPMGSLAPDFELPDLSGRIEKLSDYRGQKVLLTFFNPGCGFCVQMAPELAALPVEGREGRPLPLVVTTGDAETNRRLIEEHSIPCPVLVQAKMEVASEYRAHGTPMGYLIDEEGRIASEMAAGAEALLALAQAPGAPAGDRNGVAQSGNGHKTHPGNRALADSRINRSGLKAGTVAPEFSLPRLDGGEVSLGEYRGRQALIVFSDPDCGPCNSLAPKLEQIHRQRSGVEVLMVSRGEAEANRRKVKELGLSFPVVLQRQWEISRLYGMFATPIAYWIDAGGTIAADVATGEEQILALWSQALAASLEGKPSPGRKEEVRLEATALHPALNTSRP